MMDAWKIAAVVALAVLPAVVLGDTCLSPDVKSRSHTSTDATVSLDTAFVVEFSVTCKNGLKDLNLYAELQGHSLPASKIQGSGPYKYQVSFSEEHKAFPAGRYTIRVFDEEGYSILRKTQRSGENIQNIKSVFNIEVNHPGASKGLYVQSEFIAAAVSVLVWYFAYTTRARLQSN